MNFFADRYQFRARVIPEFLAAFPLFVFLVFSVTDNQVISALALALFFVFFQGHFSSYAGRKLQNKLRNKGELNEVKDYVLEEYKKDKKSFFVKAIKEAAEKAGMNDPFMLNTEEEQKNKISEITKWLIGQTRDTKKFPAVFDKLCDYGFYRNTLAIRRWAIISLLLSVVCFVSLIVEFISQPPYIDFTYFPFLSGEKIAKNISVVIFVLLWLFMWCKIASQELLKKANEEYIEALLYAVSSIKGKRVRTGELPN